MASSAAGAVGYDSRNVVRELACKNESCLGEPALVHDGVTGDVVCTKCGTVAEPVIDSRSEWRNFSNNDGGDGDDPSRVGGPVSALYEGLTDNSISIGRQDRGTGLAKEIGRTYNKNSMTSNQRTVLNAYKDISNFMTQLNQTQVTVETAQALFKKYEKDLRGRRTEGVVAACIFWACRQAKSPRTLKEIATITNVDMTLLVQCVKRLRLLMPEISASLPQTQDFLPRFCNELRLDKKIEQAARHVTIKCQEIGVAAAKNPSSVTGAAIYMVTQLSDTPRSAKEIAHVVGVVDSTIKNAYKEMYPHRHQLIPANFALARPIDHLPTS